MTEPARASFLVDDPDVIRGVLRHDAITAAYMLGDLAPVYADYCSWYAHRSSELDANIDALVLVYSGLSAPVVLTWGQAAGVDAILADRIDELPRRGHVHLLPSHVDPVDRRYQLEQLRPMVRMGLKAAAFSPPMPSLAIPIEQLEHRHTGEIMALYAHYPDSFFEPHQLSTGHYYGARVDDVLVSVAGVHVFSKPDRLAALGNIVTHPDFRGRGLSTACTQHLCERLIAEGTEVLALNVDRRNRSAFRVYEKLGFTENNTYLEAFLTRTLDYKLGSRSGDAGE